MHVSLAIAGMIPGKFKDLHEEWMEENYLFHAKEKV